VFVILLGPFVIRNFRGTACSSVEMLKGTYLSVEMLKGYMVTCRNAEGVHGQRKVGNPCSGQDIETSNSSCLLLVRLVSVLLFGAYTASLTDYSVFLFEFSATFTFKIFTGLGFLDFFSSPPGCIS